MSTTGLHSLILTVGWPFPHLVMDCLGDNPRPAATDITSSSSHIATPGMRHPPHLGAPCGFWRGRNRGLLGCPLGTLAICPERSICERSKARSGQVTETAWPEFLHCSESEDLSLGWHRGTRAGLCSPHCHWGPRLTPSQLSTSSSVRWM